VGDDSVKIKLYTAEKLNDVLHPFWEATFDRIQSFGEE